MNTVRSELEDVVRRLAQEAKKPIAVYTVITGGYDKARNISNVLDDADYYCFVDEDYSGEICAPWVRVELPRVNATAKDVARFCKIYAHLLFTGHELSIWLDGNIGVCGDLNLLLADLQVDDLVAAYDHWGRKNIQEEMRICALIGFDYAWVLHRQLKRYKKLKYVFRELYETNVLIRRHLHKAVILGAEIWGDEYARGGKRDQYSFTFSMWQAGVTIKSLGRHDPRLIQQYFTYHPHNRVVQRTLMLHLKRLVNRSYLLLVGWR